ncbi:MAG: hypothetical protein II776_07575, partial [Clostridia bacterium]|nr:hypothetical protein [Clostridia bacterium]
MALIQLFPPDPSPAVIRAGEVFRDLYARVTGETAVTAPADGGGDLVLIGEETALAAAFPDLAPAPKIDPGSDGYRILGREIG